MLPDENLIPTQDPKIIKPHYDAEDLKKLESTLSKISGYLDKAGASTQWKSWLQEAWTYVEPLQPQLMEGS